ncbi:DUF4386 family protein [Candidatus Dojkabacteria bacterium]|nr:DUF4386 family protein [Candidatus Dojkabacteria bacterium]
MQMQTYFQPSKKLTVLYLRVLYVIWFLVGIFSLMYVAETVLIEGNSFDTAKRIIENETLFRLGIAGALVTQLMHIVVVILFSRVFNETNISQVKLLVIFGLVGVPIAMFSVAPQILSISLAKNGDNSLMMNMLDLNEYGVLVASIFWGLWLFPLGNLVKESGYFPKFIAYPLYVGGIGYLIGTFAQIIVPDFTELSSAMEVLTFGEVLFIIWFVIVGARLEKEKTNRK